MRDPLWYRDAIIYELHVRAFQDSGADGIGDFRGLTRRLNYLADLGVTALWLLPFYPSPLRDDGYDIAGYTSVHPAYGTVRDFRALLRAAHERGARGRRRRGAPSATSTCGARRASATARLGSSSRTSRPRTGPTTRSPASTT